MSPRREPKHERAARAERALELYQSQMGIRQVAVQLEISYGTAYALIREAGGERVFRTRGTRIKPKQS